MGGCAGHGKSHSGAKAKKPKGSAKKACAVKLAKKKQDNKQMAAFIKKLRAK